MSDAYKNLEILLLRENNRNANSDIFHEISKLINNNYNVLSEDIIGPEEMHYMFECSEKGNDFMITITKRSYKDKILLFVAIYLQQEMKDNLFYDLKILLKNTLKPLAKKVYWIYDQQNEKQTLELYQLTSKAENKFRVLIVNYMTLKYGLDWWDQVATKIKTDKEKRLTGYQRALTDLEDISLDMYSLDITDLTKLVESEYSFGVNFTVEIKNHYEFPNDKELIRKTLRKELKQLVDSPFKFQLNNEKGFWKHELSVFFVNPEEFKKKWDRVSIDRNHIAHNKVIDLNMYNVMKKTCEYVIQQLDNAIDKVNTTEISQEEMIYRDTMHQQIVYDTKQRDLEATGSQIYSESQIEDIIIDYLNENILAPGEDMLYLCEALQYQEVNIDILLGTEKPQILIEATGYNGERFIFSIVNSYIDEGEGGRSEIYLKLKVDSYTETFRITFENTTVELNDDIQIYEVGIDGRLDTYELEKDLDIELGVNNIIISKLESFINEQPSNRALEKLMED